MGIRHSKLSGRKKKEKAIPAPIVPVPATIIVETNDVPLNDVQLNGPRPELHSERLHLDLTEDPNYKRKIEVIDNIIKVIDLFETLFKVIARVVPALEIITAILRRLKKLIENKQAWKDLLTSIDDRQRVFNEQLEGVKEHDIPQRLLKAMKKYAQSLEKLASRIMEQVDLSINTPSTDSRIMRIKAFVARAYNAESNAKDIKTHKAELDGVVSEVETALTIYTAITVNRIDRKQDNLKALMFLGGSNAAEMNLLGTRHTLCLENTRIDILEDIRRWNQTDGPEDKPVYCIGDMAGTGKSTVAYTMAEEWSTDQCFSFFFSTTSGDKAQSLCISLAKQIIGCCYGGELSSPTSQTVQKLWQKLVSQPLAKCIEHKDHVIVIDALDECDPKTRIPLLKCLLDTCSADTQPRLRLLLTTRKENDIAKIFAQGIYSERILHKSLLDSSTTEADIAKYVKHRIDEWEDEDFDLTTEQLDHFVKRCGGLFIFASLACGLLEDEIRINRSRRLQDIIGEFTSLDELYRQTLLLAEGSSIYTREPLRKILGTILAAQEPLSIASIAALRSQTTGTVRMLVKKLGSILGSGADDDPVHILHATLKEFLLREKLLGKNKDPNTSRENEIQNEHHIQEPENHLAMLNGCLSIMSNQLTFNICRLETSFLLNEEVVDMKDRILRWMSDGLRYSCLQWASHLELASFDSSIINKLKNFMESYFLYWLEVLSVTKYVGSTSAMLNALSEWMKVYDKDDIMAAEMSKFVTTFAGVILQSAPHIYLSALPFIPSNSPVSRCYLKLYSGTIKILRGGFSHWPLSQNILLGHTRLVHSVAFSPDSRHIASASYDCTIRVWDAETGGAVGSPFQSDELLNSVSFSPDGKRIISSSHKSTFRMRDAESGEVIGEPFKGHGDCVYSVSFSPDGKRIVSSSHDQTIRVWDAATGEAIGEPFKGHGQRVTSAAFSPDGKRIASSSGDTTIRIWDMETGEAVGMPIHGHDHGVTSVAFSPGGNWIVSGSRDQTIRVWDAETGEAVGVPLRGHDDTINSVTFSPDGERIVSGSADKTIRVWDAKSGEPVGAPFKGHSSHVCSVAFSPDGKRIASGSDDDTVRIWDAEPSIVPLNGHDSWVYSVAFSPDGKRIVSGSWDNTIRVWDAETGDAIGVPFKGHDKAVSSVAFSPDSKRIVSGSWDKTIRTWDADTGEAVGAPFNGHSRPINSVTFSPDGKVVVSGSADKTIRLWDAESGEAVGVPFKGHEDTVNSVAFSPDGRWIVSGSRDRTIRLWDAATGEAVGGPFKGHDDTVNSVSFSPDGERIVSGSGDKTIRVWDAKSGEAVGEPLKCHDSEVHSVTFSPDGKTIISGSRWNIISVWDAESGEPVGEPFPKGRGDIYSVSFSPDGKRFVSASADKTIRVWESKGSQPPSLTSRLGSESGWVVNSLSERLFWVHPRLRDGFPVGAVFIIGQFEKTFPDFTTFVYGENWTRCRG